MWHKQYAMQRINVLLLNQKTSVVFFSLVQTFVTTPGTLGIAKIGLLCNSSGSSIVSSVFDILLAVDTHYLI